MNPGEYAKHPDTRVWFAMTPNGHYANLARHTVTEHDDGTITVAPSILVTAPAPSGVKSERWHGYLERGIWRAV